LGTDAASVEAFDHLHEVEWDLDAVVGHGLGDTGGSESEAGVETGEFGAMVDEAEFHLAETGLPAMGFDGAHQLIAEAGALAIGIDGDEPEMSAIAARFDVGAGDNFVVFFEEKEAAFGEHFAEGVLVDALAFDVGALGDEGAIDQAHEGGNIVGALVAGERHALL